jgi:hypothetical protein
VPFPKKLLILGNSHTRQVATALEWQYGEQIAFSDWKDANALMQNYSDGTTVYTIFNHPSLYSPRWQQNLEQDVMGLSFSQLDAIVLGPMNPYNPHYDFSILWTEARKYADAHPHQLIDLPENRNGVSLADLVNVYSGPIVSLPGFRVSYIEDYQTSLEIALDHRPERTNLRVMYTRLPIEAMGGGNCGHDNGKVVSTCRADLDGHQCVGTHGGVPDIVAWDLVENFWDLLVP